MDDMRQAIADIRVKARELRETFGDERLARALEWAATRIEAALASDGDHPLSLRQAARLSGYSVEHLARLIRERKIPDGRPAGGHGRLVLRKRDVPIKSASRYIDDAETHDLASRLLGGKEG